MDYGGFEKFEPWSVVSALAEIRILIDCTRDQTGNLGDLLGIIAKNEGERCRERSR